ncbi:hypothetical protein ACHWQZ_G011427 [Mnemiopsis leidyi]
MLSGINIDDVVTAMLKSGDVAGSSTAENRARPDGTRKMRISVILLVSVIAIGTFGLYLVRNRCGKPYSAITKDLESRLQTYLDSTELINYEFKEYLHGKIVSVEQAARYHLTPPRIVIANTYTATDNLKEMSNLIDASIQADTSTVPKLPNIIEVKSMSEVSETSTSDTAGSHNIVEVKPLDHVVLSVNC